MSIITVQTTPYEGQKPGTSGLRKKTKVFMQPHYLANFIQSAFRAIPESEYKGQTLLVSGDGRYWNTEAIHIIAEIAAANGVKTLWVGVNGWVSTPAASAIIRNREGGICMGAFILTASHNPGGPNEDFGVKYNVANGGPSLEAVTDAIWKNTLEIKDYKKIELPKFDMSKTNAVYKLTENFTVQIIDPFEDWMGLMNKVFDFDLIRKLIADPRFSFVYDGLNGIAGPYAKELFLRELGAKESSLLRCEALEDFGGHHPDPNLTYASDLVEIMKVMRPEEADESTPLFGGAGDGDNDRNMVLGRGWFVTPSDSVAIIAAYAQACIPYFKDGIKGVARSMPTSLALKHVGEKLGVPTWEVPTGWKFFGNLMDDGKCSICGEESFGTGSDHIREKDGLWAILSWLSILAYRNNSENSGPTQRFVTIRQINEEFWAEYGRNYYTRYDYEGVEADAANRVMELVETELKSKADSKKGMSAETLKYLEKNPLADVKVFCYYDPVDKSVSDNQGLCVVFKDGSRFVLRLSGTGSSGATIRLYLERYAKEFDMETAEAMKELVQVALDVTRMEELTNRKEPTVIT